MNFHQIFNIGLPSEDLKFISFLFLSSNNCCHSNTIFGGLKIWTSIEPKPIFGFSRNLKPSVSLTVCKVTRFQLLSQNTCCHRNIFQYFEVLKFGHLQSLNLFIHFHQIFNITQLVEDLQFFNVQFLFVNSCCHNNSFKVWGS